MPADERADVERRLHRIEHEVRARHARAIGHNGAGYYGAHQLGTGRVGQGLQPAAERIHQTQASGVVGFRAFDAVFLRVIGDVGDDFVGFGAGARGDVSGHS